MKADFGKKLEEARTRQGISVKQASDALKIRSDFLLAYENDNGNFDMPSIYRKGFLKLYARYLKLDPEEIINDYIAFHKGNTKAKRPIKEEREVLGRMEIKPSNSNNIQGSLPLDAPEQPLPAFNTEIPSTPTPTTDMTSENNNPSNSVSDENKAMYWKIGLIFGGTVAVFTLIAILITSLLRPSDTTDTTLASATVTETDDLFNDSLATSPEAMLEQLVLTGEDDIDVVIRQELDKKRIYKGKVTPGSPITVTRKGPVKIHFSNGEKLIITKAGGKKVRPGRTGVGWIEI